MKRLVGTIASLIETRTRRVASTLPDSNAELRSVFRGPPPQYLHAVLTALSVEGGIEAELHNGQVVQFPVLLPLAGGNSNPDPMVGSSGVCRPDYLIRLRNTPHGKRWIALEGPGAHDVMSVTGATDDFGVSRQANGGAATANEWLHDDFIADLIETALQRHVWPSDDQKKEARYLLERAIHAAAETEGQDPERNRSWATLARALSVGEGETDFLTQWCLACGVPARRDQSLNLRVQIGVLEEMVDIILEGGFGACADRLKRGATDAESVAIDEMIAHVRKRAEIPVALPQAPQFYFSTSTGESVETPPEWWITLSTDRLLELLGDESPKPEAFGIDVLNVLVPAGRGLPAIVAREVRLQISPPSAESRPLSAVISREGAGHGNSREWRSNIVRTFEILDERVPNHSNPLRYVVSSEGYKKTAVRVVARDSWTSGLIVNSRTAAKLSLPKKAKAGQLFDYECSLTMSGEGRHFLDLIVSDGAELDRLAVGEDSTTVGAGRIEVIIASPAEGTDGPWGVEITATADCYYDIRVRRIDNDEEVIVRIFVTCEDASVEGCRSEFERLIRLNRRSEKSAGALEIQVDRQLRTADLQSWLLDGANSDYSFYPIVLASDSSQSWSTPNWRLSAGTVLSRGRFIHDPRPKPDDFRPPNEFVDARRLILERVRGDDGHGLIEAAQLGAWMSDESFAETVDMYVRSYHSWLESDPDTAPWVDTAMVTGLEADGALSQTPFAVIVNPLHPLRLGWHALAQRALFDSLRSTRRCPAASILDPDTIPDALSLPLRTASGEIDHVLFLSTDSNSDYWTVLWNSTQLSHLAEKGALAPFDREFGIQIGGVASGFSVSQVRRALDDVSQLFAAKPSLNVLVTSATAHGTACNDGIMSWTRDEFGTGADHESRTPRLGRRSLHVFDERRPSARPEDAEVANLAEDTDGAVKWFVGKPAEQRPDLGIIAQLETSNATSTTTTIASPLGRGALIRQRIRTQLNAGRGAFLSESRMGSAGPPSGDALADHVAALTARLENLADRRLGYTFAPSITTIQAVLSERNAEYVAVSSSAVDPACFLGGWLEGAYLWDYELPSYSVRPGDTSGYYLLSKVKGLDCDALRQVLAQLPGCADMPDSAIQEILLEVARRGVPTVRGLSAGHAGASGDLGLFLAGRILQDAFRGKESREGLLRLVRSDGESHEVALVVPVDPFRAYLEDLQKALGSPSKQRPDLLVFGIGVTPSRVVIRLTPIEVKLRQNAFRTSAALEALEQTRALAALFIALQDHVKSSGLQLWRLAQQHLLLSMIDFGFRVYSQREELLREPAQWAKLHQQVCAAILSESAVFEVDEAGRLIVLDATPTSGHHDHDQDSIKETIVISPRDGARLVLNQADDLYESIRQGVGDWSLLPRSLPRVADIIAEAPGGIDSADATREPKPSVPNSELRTTQTVDAPVPPEVKTEPVQEAPVGGAVHDKPLEAAPDETDPHKPERSTAAAPGAGQDSVQQTWPNGIIVRIGQAADGFHSEEKTFLPSVTDLNHLNIGVVGDLGTGKTQLVKSVVSQIVNGSDGNNGVRPRFLIFDYKKDYADPAFVAAVGAKVVDPYQLPLNLFDTTGVVAQPPWMQRFKFFADVLDRIYSNVGPVQRSNLRAAVKAAYESAAAHGREATIYDVEKHYDVAVKGKVDAPLSIISDITMSELFTRESLQASSFDAFFDGVVVVSLASLGHDDKTKNLVVAILLNLFYEFLLRLPKRGYRGTNPQLRTIDSFLLVDEADNIMKYEFDVLRTILLQGREFGVGVLLASQYLRHFKVGATDYREPLLTWLIHKVPDLKPQELGALGLTANLVQLTERVKQLPVHHCLYKTANVPGSIVAGLPFYKLSAAKDTRER